MRSDSERAPPPRPARSAPAAACSLLGSLPRVPAPGGRAAGACACAPAHASRALRPLWQSALCRAGQPCVRTLRCVVCRPPSAREGGVDSLHRLRLLCHIGTCCAGGGVGARAGMTREGRRERLYLSTTTTRGSHSSVVRSLQRPSPLHTRSQHTAAAQFTWHDRVPKQSLTDSKLPVRHAHTAHAPPYCDPSRRPPATTPLATRRRSRGRGRA